MPRHARSLWPRRPVSGEANPELPASSFHLVMPFARLAASMSY
jgi:hypothetical protein